MADNNEYNNEYHNDREEEEECGGDQGYGSLIAPGTTAWSLAMGFGSRSRPINYNKLTDHHFTPRVYQKAKALGLEQQLVAKYVEVARPSTHISRRNGITNATYRTVYIEDGEVKTRERTVRCGLCTACFKCGPVGLDCCNPPAQILQRRGVHTTNGTSKYEQVVFNREREIRGDPVHVGRIFGHTFNPPRDDTKYVQYNPSRLPLISYGPIYMYNRMAMHGSELLSFDDEGLIENGRNAFGWTEEVAREVFHLNDEDEAEEVKEAA